jgi:tRNA threonylcarbamoyladenosine biosynthesis protein TsaE
MQVYLDDVQSIASSVISHLKPGVPVLLFGPMGAGKSTMVRAILKHIIPDLGHVPSPSFPIMIPYESSIGCLWHIDLYRITSTPELAPLGLNDIMRTDICFIEWPERLGAWMPAQCHRISIDFIHTPLDKKNPDLWRDIKTSWMLHGC